MIHAANNSHPSTRRIVNRLTDRWASKTHASSGLGVYSSTCLPIFYMCVRVIEISAQVHVINLHTPERCEKNGWTGGRIAFNAAAGVALRRLPIVEICVNPSTYRGGV